MAIEVRMRKQTAVYWPPKEIGEDGQPVPGEAVELKVRWEDSAEEFITRAGTRRVSASIVYVPVVNEEGEEVKEGGWLWLGALENITDQTQPLNNDGAMSIQKFEKIPKLNGRKFIRIAYL